jgi:hypothetical protein
MMDREKKLPDSAVISLGAGTARGLRVGRKAGRGGGSRGRRGRGLPVERAV